MVVNFDWIFVWTIHVFNPKKEISCFQKNFRHTPPPTLPCRVIGGRSRKREDHGIAFFSTRAPGHPKSTGAFQTDGRGEILTDWGWMTTTTATTKKTSKENQRGRGQKKSKQNQKLKIKKKKKKRVNKNKNWKFKKEKRIKRKEVKEKKRKEKKRKKKKRNKKKRNKRD